MERGTWIGCSEHYRDYYNARGIYDATLAVLEKLREAVAIMDAAPFGAERFCAAIDMAIKQAEVCEPTLRVELRRAEKAYFGR